MRLLAILLLLPPACTDDGECGNGVVEGTEACDLGSANAAGATCKTDCTAQSCGDGAVGVGEGCDGDGCACLMSWARTFEGTRIGTDVAVGEGGEVALVGETSDGGIWMGLLDPGGVPRWTMTRGGVGSFASALGAAVDAGGSLFITGGEVVEPEHGEDLWVGRYDPSGEELWISRHAGAGRETDRGRGVALDGAGNAYVVGIEGPDSLWLRKLDPDGTERWTQSFRGVDGAPESVGIAADRDGNVVVVAFAIDGAQRDLWIRKYRSDGDPAWTRFGNGAGEDGGVDVTMDRDGNVLVVGADRGGLWIRKLDSSGEELWTRLFAGPPGSDVATDPQGNILVTGSTPLGGDDFELWVGRYDPTGNELWTRSYHGSSGGDIGAGGVAIASDGAGNVLVTGREFIEGRGNLLWVGQYPP